jgi:DnaA-homolog protein
MKQLTLDIGLLTAPSLSNFLTGPNQAALDHLRLWVGHPHRSPVPTYLWGDTASGKTHLLRAVQAALAEQGHAAPQAVGWLDPTISAPPVFNEAWCAVLLDDVDQYNSQQQQAAFNWFINAQTHQRWLLAAGRLPPADLALRDDLRTRLGWGHVFQLHVLAESERRAVLRKCADSRGIFLGDEVMDFMLKRFSRDLGSLMQLLDRLDAYALQTQRGITIALLKSMFENE